MLAEVQRGGAKEEVLLDSTQHLNICLLKVHACPHVQVIYTEKERNKQTIEQKITKHKSEFIPETTTKQTETY